MAKLIRFIFQRLLLFSLVLSVNTSCSDEPASDADTRLRLTVVTSISELGDMGYNDNMMSGIMRFYEHHDVNMSLIRPNSLDEVQQAIQNWQESTKEGPRSLLLLADNAYEPVLENSSLALAPQQQVLLVESKNTRLPEGVCTFNINRYGISYLAGCMARKHQEACVIAAMPDNPILEEAVKGYTDGYQTDNDKKVKVIYLADDTSGFNMPDSAYRVTGTIDNAFIFPLAGGSNNGIYKYSRETPFYMSLVAGMDADCSLFSSRIPFSVVIYIDRLLENYLVAWYEGQEFEPFRTYGMDSGMADIIMNPVFYKYLEIWEEYYGDVEYWNNAYRKYKDEALEKEMSYVAN